MDDPQVAELKELVRQNMKVSQETNAMVHSMRRTARVNTFFHLLYWVVIIAALGTSYFFVSPYLQQLKQIYTSLQSSASQSQDLEQQIGDFFKKFGQTSQ